MKNIGKYFVMTVLMAGLACTSVFGDSGIKVTMNGSPMQLSKVPLLESGRTLMPMRTVFESFGFNVVWDEKNHAILAKKDTYEVTMTVGSTAASVNRKEASLDVPPMIVDGSTYVPLRFVAEALGAEVAWDSATSKVLITTAELDKGAAFEDTRLTEVFKKRLGKDTFTIRDFYYMTDLSLTREGIYSIGGIENFRNLKSLDISQNSITLLEPLTKLSSLIILNASNNQIKDATPLKRVKGLETLDISNNKIKDFTPFVDMASIKDLKIRYNESTDYSPLYFVKDRYRSLDAVASSIEIPKYDTVVLRNGVNYVTPITGKVNWVPSCRLGNGEYTNEAIQNMLTIEGVAKANSIHTLYDALRLMQVNKQFLLEEAAQQVKEADSERIWVYNPGGSDTLRINKGNQFALGQTLGYLLNQDYPENGFLLVFMKDGSQNLVNYLHRDRIEKEKDPKDETKDIFVTYPEYYFVNCSAYVLNAKDGAAPETGMLSDFSAVKSTSNVLMTATLQDYVSYLTTSNANIAAVVQMKYDSTKDMTIPIAHYEAGSGDSKEGIRILPKAFESVSKFLYESTDSPIRVVFEDPNEKAPDPAKLPTFDYRLYTK